MRKLRRLLTGMAMSTTLLAPLAAQENAQCVALQPDPHQNTQVRRVCDAALDGAAVFTPVAGILMTGGNPLLGSTGGLHGFGHIGITLRVNATSLVIPDLSYNGTGTTVGAKQTLLAPAPLVEGGFGLFRGLHHGTLAIDLLGSAQLLPTKLFDDVRIDVNARAIGSIALGLGIGGRLTLLGENRVVPGVTVSVMHRTLPRIGVGDVLLGDNFSYATELGSTEYRAVVGKHFSVLQLGVGGGWTDYRAQGDVTFRDPETDAAGAPIPFDIHDSRAVGFVDGGLILGSVYLIGEAGIQRGKDLNLVTTFVNNDPARQRVFGSLGLRLGF